MCADPISCSNCGLFVDSMDLLLRHRLHCPSASFLGPRPDHFLGDFHTVLPTGKEMKYVCDKCSRRFSYKQSLTRHKWKCEASRVLNCKYCSYQAFRMDSLKDHCLSKHRKSFTGYSHGEDCPK